MDPTIPLLSAVAVTGVIVGAYFFARWQGWRRAGNDTVYHFRCGGCGRRLRFHARQQVLSSSHSGSVPRASSRVSRRPAAPAKAQ